MEVEINYETGDGGSVKREEIQRLLRTGQSSCSLGGNRRAVMDPDQFDDAMESIADCDPQQAAPGVFRVDAVQAAYLQHSAGDLGLPAADQLRPAEENDSKLHLGSLKPVLRPYQREGGLDPFDATLTRCTLLGCTSCPIVKRFTTGG